MVADGRDRDPAIFPNKSSPTVVIHSVYTVLGLMAAMSRLIVVKIDINGAFLQTPMTGGPIYMRLDQKLTHFTISLFPKLKMCTYKWFLKVTDSSLSSISRGHTQMGT